MFLERISQSKEHTVLGWQIYNYLNVTPIFRNGIEMKYYEVEEYFKRSNRQWVVRVDTLEDGSEQVIIVRTKF